jgi:hypothetical protein
MDMTFLRPRKWIGDARRIALLILSTNYWPALRNCRDAIKIAIQELQPGQYVEFEI